MYVESQAFRELAKQGTTLLLPANASEPSSMIAQAMSIFKNMSQGGVLETTNSPQKNKQPSGAFESIAKTPRTTSSTSPEKAINTDTNDVPFSLQTKDWGTC